MVSPGLAVYRPITVPGRSKLACQATVGNYFLKLIFFIVAISFVYKFSVPGKFYFLTHT
jgi:hypothetical protein